MMVLPRIPSQRSRASSMQRRLNSAAISSLALLILSACGSGGKSLETRSLQLMVSAEGQITRLVDRANGTDYLGSAPFTPLLTLGVAGEMLQPERAIWSDEGKHVTLEYVGGLEAEVGLGVHDSHLTFELIALSNPDTVEVAVWGPIPSLLNDMIGETIGVVSGQDFAVGIQALNLKTLGGYPWNDDDHLPQLDAFEQEDPEDLTKGTRGVLYSVEAARPTREGSSLQAYCRNRNSARVIKNMGRAKYVAPSYNDGGLVGCKVALFGSTRDSVLATIGEIELAEGLPHPMLDGEWVKTNPRASAAYIILPFSEATFDAALDVTERAGLNYLYHPGPFETWGKFGLDPRSFPNGVEGLRALSDRAAERGIKLGVHTLSNFITTDDPYVTPVPDPRLARVGESALTVEVSARQREIRIEDPTYFSQQPDNLHAAVIDDEIVRYGGVSAEAPWRLLDVERGAFGTRASSHTAGAVIGKLADHAYNVFLSNADLTVEIAENLADLYNRAGLRQISFDGLEGNHSTGLGNYGEALFTNSWFNALNDDIKSHYIADASRPGHFFWHMYTRMNWGEPWYAGFRESQTEYRLRNQEYFRRNYMPGMLGWFSLTSSTTIEDTDWMLARSAAFDAGYAFNMSLEVLEENGVSAQILAHLGEWERARFANAFTEEQKEWMRNPNREFSLDPVSATEWDFAEIHVQRFEHKVVEKQPGEPTGSRFEFANPVAEQSMTLLITASEATVSNIRGEIDDFQSFEFDVTLLPGETLRYDGGDSATLFDDTWHLKRNIPVERAAFVMTSGDHSMEVDAEITGDADGAMKIELRLAGATARISSGI
jgi:hypothetical protein